MMKVYKHGIYHSNIASCPYCKCVMEYTEDEINEDGYIKCPECHDRFIPNAPKVDTPKYVRDFTKEAEAINKCLDDIDFESLGTACYILSQNMPEDYDYLEDNTAEVLREKARKEIAYCFDNMEKYGYLIHYKGGDVVYSYTTDGAFEVNTYYDPIKDMWWCNCVYYIGEGGLY